jgi:hypothetical protein
MIAAAKAVKKVADIEAAKAVGHDQRLSGFGRRAKLFARDDLDFEKAQAEVIIQAVPPGLWSILSFGAAPHVIGFGRSRGGGNYNPTAFNRRTGKRGSVNRRLRQPGAPGRTKYGSAWRTGPVFHPGTSPKGTWQKVRRRSKPLVLKIFADALHEAVSGG